MVKCFQQRYLFLILANSILLCFGIQCEDECCYWYRRSPATPSTCLTNQATTVSLICDVQHNNSNNIEVRWYRSRDEESAGINGASEIMINDTKYHRTLTVNPEATILSYGLGILNFSSTDRGYYWCQMVVNNISLSPSPYGYISSSQCNLIDTICTIVPPLCAHNTSTRYMAHRQMNTSCLLQDFNNTTRSQITTISSFPTTTDNMTMSSFAMTEVVTVTTSTFPTTVVVSTIVVSIILFTLTILFVSSIVYVKRHKGQSKEHDVIIHHCEKFELEESKDDNDISNPHYIEVRIATDHNRCPLMHEGSTVANEKSERGESGSSKTEYDSSNLTTEQHLPHSEVEEAAQINNSHGDQIKNQESHRIHTETDVSAEYATVDKSKKTSKLQSNDSSATKADSAMENPQYDKLKQDEPAKDIITSKEGKGQMDYLREKSPSPEYAELSAREKKVPTVTKYSTEKEKDSKSDSHEYDKVAGMAQASAKVTEGDTDDSEIEQHYYYTLENPEESCSNCNGKEETTETISSGEMEYSMPQAHHLVIDNVPIAPNTDAKAELVRVREINASPLDSQQGEASTDNA